MKSRKKEEKKLSLNQTVNFEQKSIQLYKKFSSPNLLSFPKKDKYILRLNKIRRKKLDSVKMLNFGTLEQKLMNSYKDSLLNRKTVDEENTHFIRKIKINGNFKNNYELEQSFGNNIKNNQRTTPESKNGKESKLGHKLLYEDIIKLKDKMNKLKLELCFVKSLNRKKDEEIRELLKYKEDAKFYSGKKENEIFYQKLKIIREIINLKNLYENIKIDFIKQKDINDSITNQIKILNITEMKNKNEKNKKKLKKKLEKYNKIRRKNDELEIELTDSDWVKNKFMENHKYLTELEIDIDKKFSKIKLLHENLAKLKEKYEIMKNKKSQMIRRNSSIKSDNKKLLKDKKSRQEYVIKQTEIEKKITLYKTKTRDLINETNEKESLINDLIIDKKKFNFNLNLSQSYNFQPILQKNPDNIKEKQVTLYESLIQDSKNKQNEIIVKIKDLFKKTKINKNNNIKKDIIINKNLDNCNNNNNINNNNDNNNINNKINNINNNNINNNNDLNDNSQIFSNNAIINSGINDINIEEKEKVKEKENYNKNDDFIFLLNIVFCIKNITKEKIQNILLNYKTENYYVGDLGEGGGDFLQNLSSEISLTIHNKTDINNLKEILLFILQNKYQGKNILFLDKAIEDIYIIDNNTKFFFDKKDEKNMVEQIKKIFSKKNINSLIEKIKKNKNNIIYYEQLRKIINEEKIFINEKEDKNRLFQFFIYFLKKKENYNKKYFLKEFNTKNILSFLNDINLNNKEDNTFIIGLKNFLKNKNINLENLLGVIDTISITEFINKLNENEFKIENVNLDLYCALQKYETEINSGNIDINLLQKDLDNI